MSQSSLPLSEGDGAAVSEERQLELKAGETKKVQFELDRAAFSYWSPKTKDWVAEPGRFEIQVGASSRDIRVRGTLELKQ